MKSDDEQSLKEAGFSFGSSNKNILKIIPRKTVTPPAIVISLANKGEENSESLEGSGTSDSASANSRRIKIKTIKYGRRKYISFLEY